MIQSFKKYFVIFFGGVGWVKMYLFRIFTIRPENQRLSFWNLFPVFVFGGGELRFLEKLKQTHVSVTLVSVYLDDVLMMFMNYAYNFITHYRNVQNVKTIEKYYTRMACVLCFKLLFT